GEVFRSGCVFLRGLGKIFYFSPGHETYPIFELPDVQKIIINAVKWAAPPIQNIIGTGHFKESPESNYS
ncbi:MAG: hypothetical protein FWF03_03620, partial [Defluviitaleaceae bacterium]|nr:hypothetical protein [Defluviitaleaceae bacterium]